MLDEGIKILGPFPIFQVILGLAVLGGGVFMIVKGLSGNGRKSPFSLEDKRAEWAAYEQLRNIEENTLKMIELLKRNGDLLRKLEETTKALVAALWNRGSSG